MKFLTSLLLHFYHDRPSRVSIMALLRFLVVLAAMVTVYSVLFHFLMAYEGRQESWITGFYWTLTVMSTLGFGDITFQSDLGRLFSTLVLFSGIIFLLVLLPFTFIEFFYAPWTKAQEAARAPKELPEDTENHVIIIHHDSVTDLLIRKLNQYQYRYVLLIPDLEEALRLHDLGYSVVRGDPDSPETYRRLRVEKAALVAATANDRLNTNVAFTVRDVTQTTPIIATASYAASVDILELAGCDHVLQFGEMMGQGLARRVSGGASAVHIIGRFGDLLIAEATARQTSLVGKTLRESRLREHTGATVLGVWDRGVFENAGPDTRIEEKMMLVLGGTAEQLQRYETHVYGDADAGSGPAIIIGGGRVGRAAGNFLAEQSMDYRIVEQLPERIRDPHKYIQGDAAELEVLEAAGIQEAQAVLVTTHDDDTNIYLTIYVRRLRPNVQLVSRARLARNVDTLHRAGADFVLSYASMGSDAIINLLSRSNILMVSEGLDAFAVQVPSTLAGKTLAQTDIRRKTGATVVALNHNGRTEINPDPNEPLPAHTEMILIGAEDAQAQFLKRFVT
ncbi:MAG TPA: NAD-binding protein [Candidatus Sulfomarinibacteraceae bacterium]|nr:NAD-binding protein [Candidatus Sulfomarinibacteraceae bacterium]